MKEIAIVALGPSAMQFDPAAHMNGAVWAVKPMDDRLGFDTAFHMDDVRVLERRIATGNDPRELVLRRIIGWFKEQEPGTVFTSYADPRYPCLVEYPLEFVVGRGEAYFNNTTAYAVAYALALGVTHLNIYGADYTYADQYVAETGRACTEYWVGRAQEAGVKVYIPRESTLLSADLYGYELIMGAPGDTEERANHG